jgi:hypothetical protein
MMPTGDIDISAMATAGRTSFHGEVEAASGVITDPDGLHQIQGSWTHERQRKGSFHALSYSSLACGCDGVFNGNLCPAADHSPGTVVTPANMVCYTGVGTYTAKSGRTRRAAFRIEGEDRGVPGTAGINPGDIYRIRIWFPKANETAEGLVSAISCSIRNPESSVRAANINDSGSVTGGDLKIATEGQ